MREIFEENNNVFKFGFSDETSKFIDLKTKQFCAFFRENLQKRLLWSNQSWKLLVGVVVDAGEWKLKVFFLNVDNFQDLNSLVAAVVEVVAEKCDKNR